MDIGSVLLFSGLTILVIFIVIKPLFEISPDKKLISKTQFTNEISQKKSILLAERDRVLRSLQELDFDYSLGKIPQEDYPTQRSSLLRKGAELIKSLDEMSGKNSEDDNVELVEAVVEANRADARKVELDKNEDSEISALLAARRRIKQEKPTGFCPKCGKPVTSSDKFCARCGKVLE